MKVDLREKDKMRKRQRAKTILQLQQNMKQVNLQPGEYLFRKGEEGEELYIVEEGRVRVTTGIDDAVVLMLGPGELTGEHALIFGRPRNVDRVFRRRGAPRVGQQACCPSLTSFGGLIR